MRYLLPKLGLLSWIYAMPIIVLLLSFSAILCWAYRRGAQAHYERMGSLPLDEDSAIDGAVCEETRGKMNAERQV